MAIEETERILESLGYKIRATEGVSIFLEEGTRDRENHGEQTTPDTVDPLFEEMAEDADYMIMFLPEKGERSVSSPVPVGILEDLSVTTKTYLKLITNTLPVIELHQLPTEGENTVSLQNGTKRISFLFNKIENKVLGRLQTKRGGRWKPSGKMLPDVYISDLEVILNAGKILADGIRILNQKSDDGSGAF